MVPAVAGFKKQGASNGACLSFLISTPETGVDSIALTYSLMDPIITVIRPITAFFTAVAAGVAENFLGKQRGTAPGTPGLNETATFGDCSTKEGEDSQTGSEVAFAERMVSAFRFSFDELMGDLAPWFILGILLAGVITALVPDSVVKGAFGSGPLG